MDNSIIDRDKMVIYKTEDGKTKVEVFLENDNIWLSQEQIANLFEKK